MKRYYSIIIVGLFFLKISDVVAQNHGTFIHDATADSYIRGGTNSEINYGGDVELLVKGAATNENNNRVTILKFDLSDTDYDLDESSSIVLRLHTFEAEVSMITAYQMGDDWDESTVTWDNAPVTEITISTIDMGPEEDIFYEWDVTSYVTSELAGDKIISIAIRDSLVSSADVSFSSRQVGFNVPHLAVTLEDPTLVAIPAIADAEVFYWGIPAYEKNYGNREDLSVRFDDNVSSCTDSYIAFDISSLVTQREQVFLKLYAFEVERASEISTYATETEVSWSETSIKGSDKPFASHRTGIHEVYSTGFVNLDVTNQVNKAIEDGWDNITIILKENDGAKISFDSKESTHGPELLVSMNEGSYVSPTMASGTFYIDATGGDDSNDGQSEGTAWQNITRVNDFTFEAGSSILLKRGETWSGQGMMFKGSGTDGSPIKIGAYGTGDKPLLEGLGASKGLIRLFNQEYIEISDLHITNLGAVKDGLRRGIHVVADNFGAVNHMHFTNLKFTDINGTDGLDGGVFANEDDEKRSGAIYAEIRGDDVQTYFDDLLLERSYFYDVGNTGFANTSHWSELELNSTFDSNTVPGTEDEHYIHNFVPSKNVVIRRNRFENINSQGMIIRTAENPIMEYNLFYYCSIGRGSDNACFNSKTVGAVWRYNESCFTEYTEGKSDGAGIDSDLRSKNTLIEYNYCHDNEYGGVITTGGSFAGAFNDSTIIRYNVLINNKNNSVRVANQNTNLMVHNNLVYYNDETQANKLVFTHLSDRTEQGPINSVVANNIFYAPSGNGYFTEDVELTDPRFEQVKYTNNLYYGMDSGFQYPDDSNLVTADPLFVNGVVPSEEIGGYVLLDESGLPTGELNYDFLAGFSLTDLSPALDAGVVDSITVLPNVDFGNESLFMGFSVDIGPFESRVTRALAAAEDNGFDQTSIYPNPTSDYINVKLPDGVNESNISLYTVSGQLITTLSSSKERITLNIASLDKGIYYMKLQGDFGTVVKKVVKK